MSLRKQLLGGFATLLVPVVLVALVALATIDRLGGAVDAVLLENERSLAAAAGMDVALERLDSAALLALLGRDAEAAEIAATYRPRFQDALAVAAGNLTIEGEEAIVGDVEAGFEAYVAAFDSLVAAEPEAARAAYAEAFVPAFERTRGALETLESVNREAAQSAAQNAGSMAQTALWLVVVGTLVALVLGVWAAIKLSRQIAAQHER